MKEFENNAFFWQKIDTLIFSSQFEILYKKGETHAEYKSFSYPVDFGCLTEIKKEEGDKISVFKGSGSKMTCNAVVITADILKKELKANILIDCTEEEEKKILEFLNKTDLQKAVLIHRGTVIPSWGLTD